MKKNWDGFSVFSISGGSTGAPKTPKYLVVRRSKNDLKMHSFLSQKYFASTKGVLKSDMRGIPVPVPKPRDLDIPVPVPNVKSGPGISRVLRQVPTRDSGLYISFHPPLILGGGVRSDLG